MLSSAAWTKAGTMLSGVCWERMMSVPRMSESDVGFSEKLPTMTASDCKIGCAKQAKRSRNLRDYVSMFPTPTVNGNHNRKGLSKNSGDGLATFVKRQMFRTPDTNAGGRSGLLAKGITHRKNGQPIQVRLVDQVGGKLNPQFVEWLMGFPIGFTDLEGLATPRCRSVPQPRSKRSCGDLTKASERTCRNCQRLDMKKQKCEHFQQEGKAYPVTILGLGQDDIDVPVFLSKNEVDKAYADGTLGSDDDWTQCINWKEKRVKNNLTGEYAAERR